LLVAAGCSVASTEDGGAGGEGGQESAASPSFESGGEAGTPSGGLGRAGEAGVPSGGAGGEPPEPPEPVAGSLKLATFNIRDFGQTKLGRPDVMAALVQIVRSYPFVAVQEISDIEQEVPYAFLNQLNAEDDRFAMLLSPRSGQQPDDVTYQEQYAFYYDTQVLEASGDGLLFDDTSDDFFVREPYAARFVAAGGFSFVAITFHAQPDTSVQEMEHLHDVVVWAKGAFPEEDDFIILGDLNADCSYASPAELDSLTLRGGEYQWLVPDDADTTLAASECAYDRFVMTAATSTNAVGTWGVDRVFTDTRVSDHFPVWAEFWSDERQ
jgi:endonuclease/exonuclease/phosphatase family metal-dependent hydrolase